MSHTFVSAIEPGWLSHLLAGLFGLTLTAGLVGQLAVTALWLKN